jgi:hypothetical protein
MTDVSLSHRDVTRPGHGPDVDGSGDLTASPPAQRLQRHRWRDPRLWLGVVLVLVSVLAGAALFSRADDTVPVWAADDDIQAGTPLTSDNVHSTRIHFSDSSDASRYLSASDPLPAGAIAVRDVSAGELVAVSAISTSSGAPDRLPLAVGSAGLPAGLEVGDTVDVWAVPGDDTTGAGSQESVQVLDGVTVTSLGAEAAGGLDSTREVLVALPAHTDVGDALDALSGSDVVLVLVGR